MPPVPAWNYRPIAIRFRPAIMPRSRQIMQPAGADLPADYPRVPAVSLNPERHVAVARHAGDDSLLRLLGDGWKIHLIHSLRDLRTLDRQPPRLIVCEAEAMPFPMIDLLRACKAGTSLASIPFLAVRTRCDSADDRAFEALSAQAALLGASGCMDAVRRISALGDRYAQAKLHIWIDYWMRNPASSANDIPESLE